MLWEPVSGTHKLVQKTEASEHKPNIMLQQHNLLLYPRLLVRETNVVASALSHC